MSDDIPDDTLNQAMDDHEAKQTKGQATAVVAQPYFSPSELAESKWPDIWRKKVLCCNNGLTAPDSEIWPDVNTRCVMCGGKFVEDVCALVCGPSVNHNQVITTEQSILTASITFSGICCLLV